MQGSDPPGGTPYGAVAGGRVGGHPLSGGPLSKLHPPPPLAFELLAEVATGPTARVELCRIREPEAFEGQLVAVKRLHPHIAEDPQFASMFVDEVWMTAALVHPNVVRVAGWGTDREGTYLAVELVQGVSLARLMKTVFETREVFSERMVVYLGSEICAGLAAAHALRGPDGEPLSLVHRDLTPGNVLLGFDGQVKIADFGLAKAKQRVTKTLTGLLKGHPQYMAPEQATDGAIDGRADLFSLGVVLFELFTGKHPWSGGNEIEIFHVMAEKPPLDILGLRPRLDKELANLVAGLLERDPTRRYKTADEVRLRLLSWLDIHGYKDDNDGTVARFVRRNAMRQMRWFERAIGGELRAEAERNKARLSSASPARAVPRELSARNAASSSRRRRRLDEPTEVSTPPPHHRGGGASAGAEAPSKFGMEDPISAEWSEEVPTVVKPTAPAARSRRPDPVSGHPAADSADGPLTDEDSDNRTTAVKPKSPAASVIRKLPPPRVATPPPGALASAAASDSAPTHPTAAGRASSSAVQAPPSQDTLLDMPVAMPDALVDGDSGDETEVPTHPLRAAVHAPRGHGAPLPIRAPEELALEVERLAGAAARLRADADRSAKVAAHRAVLAQLAAEAAQLAQEAARAFASPAGSAHGAELLREARRLEATVRRGEAHSLSGADDDVPTGRTSTMPPAVVEATSGISAFSLPQPGLAQPGHVGHSLPVGRISAPPPEPGYVRSSAPPPEPIYGAQMHASESGRPPPMGGAFPSFQPPARTFTDELRLLVSGEVFGLPVPVALGVAFALALAFVVLAAVFVG